MSSSDEFIVLPENRFAYTAIVERSPCVFLYGPSGVGKSHLARIAVEQMLRQQPSAPIQSLNASGFAAEFAGAADAGTIAEFQKSYRRLDLLVLEDIHALESRGETQQQLLAVVNELTSRGCMLVWTCPKSPGELVDFLPKLVSRFRAGVMAHLRLPDAEGRRELVSYFAKTSQVSVSEDVVSLIATELPYSPRELQAFISRIDADLRGRKRPVNSDTVRKLLRHEVHAPELTMVEITRAVARYFGVSAAKIRSASRSRQLVLPRQCAMLLARDLTGKSLAQIGHFFGDRDHSTVVHACRRLQELLASDAESRSHLSQLRTALGATEVFSPP